MPTKAICATLLIPHLRRCKYTNALLATDYDFGTATVPLAAFADTPHDARSICIAAIDPPSDPPAAVDAIKPLGAPVVFSCYSGKVQWWKQTTGTPQLIDIVDASRLSTFFEEHAKDFAPTTIFEGKTRRRLPGQTQLSFVDAGLMPLTERTEGERLSRLVEAALRDIEETLNRSIQSRQDVSNAIKATFWLLAAKALHDKGVDGFKTVDLANIDDVFGRVGRHYGVPGDIPPPGRLWRAATIKAAERFSGFDSLRHLSTESLAHVYENALVTPAVRKANGTHSTPGSLVDYMVWQLWPWMEALPPDRRHVFEPGCGHAAFLVSALRILRQWSGIHDGNKRHEYLKKHLHGIEDDEFAVEVARLSLTLADIPHGNRWNLKREDMFVATALEEGAQNCGLLLANPPYEKFTASERKAYKSRGVELKANTKVCEMLARTIPRLSPGACFGVVVPQGLLHNKEAIEIRRQLLDEFEIAEIDAFEDKLFEKADHEAAVLLGRRKTSKGRLCRLWFRRVRNPGIPDFHERFAFSSEETADLARFASNPSADLRIPELDSVWRYLKSYPTLDSCSVLGQGLAYKGRSLPKGAWTIHDPPEANDARGFANVPDNLCICGLPPVVGMNLDRRVLLHIRTGLPWKKPQVLINYSPVSREPWRLKATLDPKGRALTSRFIAVRPIEDNVTSLYLWSLLNSPLANAFAFCHLGKRDILVGTMRKMPVPKWSSLAAAQIEQAAMRYRTLATSPGPLFEKSATSAGIRRALLDMDAAVLRTYDLPPRLEHQLLSLFWGISRKGVGCEFGGYYRPDFRPYVSLAEYLSEGFQRATAGQIVRRYQPVRSKAALSAIDTIIELHKAE